MWYYELMSELTNNSKDQASSEPELEQLVNLAESLGFRETEEMVRLRESLDAQNLDETREKLINYQIGGENEVDKLDSSKRTHAQIGLIIASARVYHQLGLSENFIEAIEDAITYADNMGLPETVRDLEELLNKSSH
jgi:hypothetical protein